MKTDCCVFVEVSLGVVGGGTRLSSSERGWMCPSCDWRGHPGHLLLLLLLFLLLLHLAGMGWGWLKLTPGM